MLLQNNQQLPLDASRLKNIAVIGAQTDVAVLTDAAVAVDAAVGSDANDKGTPDVPVAVDAGAVDVPPPCVAQVEVCNGKDDDCDGQVDNGGNGGQCTVFYEDKDGDGYGQGAGKCQCAPGGMFVAALKGDCDDNDPKVNPKAAEVCNGVDDNCDGVVDGANLPLCKSYYLDADGDGYISTIDCDDGDASDRKSVV